MYFFPTGPPGYAGVFSDMAVLPSVGSAYASMQDRENRIKVASVEGGLGALGVAQLFTIEVQSGQKAVSSLRSRSKRLIFHPLQALAPITRGARLPRYLPCNAPRREN